MPDVVVLCMEERAGNSQLGRLSLSVLTPKWDIPALSTCPRRLGYLPHLCALQSLHLSLTLPEDADWALRLHRILRSVLRLPSLSTLDIEAQPHIIGLRSPRVDWTNIALPSTAPLRHLRLAALSLSAESAVRLCYSPLQSLEPDDCYVERYTNTEQQSGPAGLLG